MQTLKHIFILLLILAVTVTLAPSRTYAAVSAVGALAENTDAIAGATSWTTSGTLAASNNKLYIAYVGAKTTTGWNSGNPALTGAGITWVYITKVTYAGDSVQSNLVVFRGLVTSGATTGALTFDPAGSDDIYYPRIQVLELDGMDTSGTNGSGAVQQSVTTNGNSTGGSVAITMTTGTALVSGWHNNGTNPITPRASWTETYDAGSGNGITETQYFISTDTAVSATWTGTANYTGIGLEINPASSGTPPIPAKIAIMAPTFLN